MRPIDKTAIKNPAAFLRPINLEIFKIVTDYIEQARVKSVLDVGAGICLLNSILELEDDAARFASDIRTDNLLEGREVLQKHGQSAHLVNNWAQRLPFKDDSFDCAAILTVFINIDDLNTVREVVSEMKRVVKPGGFAVFEYRNKYNVPLRIKHLLNRVVEKSLPITAFSPKQFSKILDEAGWKEELIIPVWSRIGILTPSYVVIARKQ
ncbi:MAG: methyltransferase domain-containing protein [FCB group bacterium]|nr:methyltransferase domain-containing protein [FCB group bacterium]